MPVPIVYIPCLMLRCAHCGSGMKPKARPAYPKEFKGVVQVIYCPDEKCQMFGVESELPTFSLRPTI